MNIQLTKEGRLKHFLTTEGLSREMLTEILDTAESFSGIAAKPVKKIPLLRGKTIINLFFENSTRTRTSFELAAKRLSADVINISVSTSATAKGESLLDTLRNLEALYCDMFVVRHADSGAAHFIAQKVAPHVSVVNAGDGWHSHPTQAMLDIYTIRQAKGRFEGLKVAIIGDIKHSRVARANIHALLTLGVEEVRCIAPKTLIPIGIEQLGVKVMHNLHDGLRDVDVVITLRLQHERMQGMMLPGPEEFFHLFGVKESHLEVAKPDVIIMHPGPINRGVEVDSCLIDGPRSMVLKQVTNGLAVRMAVMSMVLGSRPYSQEGADV